MREFPSSFSKLGGAIIIRIVVEATIKYASKSPRPYQTSSTDLPCSPHVYISVIICISSCITTVNLAELCNRSSRRFWCAAICRTHTRRIEQTHCWYLASTYGTYQPHESSSTSEYVCLLLSAFSSRSHLPYSLLASSRARACLRNMCWQTRHYQRVSTGVC